MMERSYRTATERNARAIAGHVETPGARTWMVWRRSLAAFAPLLFQTPETQ